MSKPPAKNPRAVLSVYKLPDHQVQVNEAGAHRAGVCMNYTDLMKFFGCEPLEGYFPTFRELMDQRFKQITTHRGIYFVIDETKPTDPIAYIGMASTSLRSRVRALVMKKDNHRGGSDIWALPHYESLRICWKVNKCARDYEIEFIERFEKINSKKPFANKKA